MTKVLAICHGNICRSTMAQFVLQDMVNKLGVADQFEIESAAVSREEIGNGVHHGTVRKLNQVGIPVGDHRAVQVTKADYDHYDYLLIMDESNRRLLERIVGKDVDHKVYRLLEFAGKHRDIADPWYTGNFDVTYDDIDEGCRAFLKYLGY